MDYVFDSLLVAIKLILPVPSPEVIEPLLLSIFISGTATIISSSLAIPSAIFISLKKFKLRRVLISLINGWFAVPSVAIGLIVYGFLSRKGPLGQAGLLFTPSAIIIAQTILAFPLILALAISTLKKSATDVKDLSESLGADKFQTAINILKEHKHGIITAIILGFSRVIGETGMTLMVGGNIKGYTRVLTTSIALETMKGNFETGLALGILLVIIALIINFFIQQLSKE